MGHGGDLGADHVDPAPQVGVVLHDPQGVGVDGDPAMLEHRGDQEHVRALVVRLQVEPLGGPLPEHGRGERPEALAELDLEVHGGLHGRRAGIAQDAARAQGPGAELHPALEPADDLAVGQQGGDVVEQLALVGEPLAGCAVRGQGPLDLVGREARAEEAPLLGVVAVGPAGVVQELMPDEQGRAQRAAGIAGRRLDPEVVEVALAEQPAVGHAVERHAAGQDQVLHPGPLARTWRPIRSTASSVTAWMLAARSMCRCSRGDSGERGGPPKRRWNRRLVIVSPWQ